MQSVSKLDTQAATTEMRKRRLYIAIKTFQTRRKRRRPYIAIKTLAGHVCGLLQSSGLK